MDGEVTMATTLKLEHTRFVRQVSNGAARTKSSYQAMQQDLLSDLRTAPWTQATCPNNTVSTVVNKVTETDKVVDESGAVIRPPSFTSFLREQFDAFKQGGDADKENDSFCGYAGMVAYRFSLPDGYASNISQISMRLAAARYLRSGLRVAVVLSDDATPSDDWATIRGEVDGAVVTASEPSDADGVSSWGFLGQSTVNTLLESQAREGLLTFSSVDYPAIGTSDRHAYVWVYVSLEDYTDRWVLYDRATPRYYSIEGSATLVGSSFEVTFAGEVSPQPAKWFDSLYITQDMVLPNVAYTPKGTPEDDYATKYGNFVQGIMRSSLYAMRSASRADNGSGNPSYRDSVVSIGVLQRFADFPRKNLFDFEGDDISSVPANAPLVRDVGVFAGVRAGYSKIGSSWTTSTPFRNEIAVHFRGNGNTNSVLVGGRIPHAGAIDFSSRFVVVSPGESAYRRLRLKFEPDFSGDIEVGVNVWMSRSADVLGVWGIAAASALCSHQEVFTGERGSVEAELVGDGTETSEMVLKASAKLVGYAPIQTSSGQQTVDVSLSEDVLPGSVVILAPKLVRVAVHLDENSVTRPYIVLQPSEIRFAK